MYVNGCETPMTIIDVNYGSYNNAYTYMGWQLITARDSLQYKLKEESGMHFDSEGFGVINGCYVIACTTTFGSVGDYIDWTLADGSILHTIVGDLKSSGDPNWTPMGHVTGNALSVVEFVVNRDTWYPSHVNPGNPGCHPEWAGKIQKADNYGNYWTGTSPRTDGTTGAGLGNQVIVSAMRYFQPDYYNVTYVATLWADGFCYFNDYEFFRCYTDGSNLQVFYIPKQIWIKTDKLQDISISALNTNSIAAAPGQGVEDAVKWMIAIAEDNSHGYDQDNRWGPDYDCSSLIYEGFRVGGGFSGLPTHSGYTGTMVKDFTAVGFNWNSGGAPKDKLIRGDIELNIQNHTECYIGNGQNVGAHINEFGKTKGGRPGDQSGREICVADYWNDNWDGFLRYAGSTSTAAIATLNLITSQKPITLLHGEERTDKEELLEEIANDIKKGKFYADNGYIYSRGYLALRGIVHDLSNIPFMD